MENLVIAEVEIDGKPIPHYTDIFLQQHFNQHHVFSIKLNHDVLETFGSFGLDNSKNLIGKSVIIKFFQVSLSNRKPAYEFAGIITEIAMVQSNSASGDLLIKGFSPTILLEDGTRYASFNDKNLKDIVTQSIQSGMSKTNAQTHIAPNYTNPIKYISQYKESTFHFLNRLSSVYGELFYYNGSTLIFGQPQSLEFVDVVYGVDMNDMQLNLHVEPIEVWESGYVSEDNTFITSRGDNLNGLDEYANHVVQVSNNLYSDVDDIPLLQRVKNIKEATTLVNKRKEAIAAGLVVLSGSTNNPNIVLGCVADVKISKNNGSVFTKADYGAYLVTSITHHISGTGKYYNSFKALSGWVKGIPVYNAAMPVGEPQMGWITDNNDPAKIGRVRVKMEWQQDNEKTDWIWVMTPDAGGGKDGAPNRGFVVIPEVGDRVMIGFTFNNPDRPFVMGSLFHGKSGGGKDKGRTIINNFNTTIQLLELEINIIDGNGNLIKIDGNGNINIQSSVSISLKCGSSEIKATTDKISLIAPHIFIQGTSDVNMCSDASTQTWIAGTNIDINGTNAKIHGKTQVNVEGGKINVHADAKVDINGKASVDVAGGMVNINP